MTSNPTEDRKTAGQQLKAARGALSQRRAAAAVGVPYSTFRDWEQGQRRPPDYTLRQVTAQLRRVTGTTPTRQTPESKRSPSGIKIGITDKTKKRNPS